MVHLLFTRGLVYSVNLHYLSTKVFSQLNLCGYSTHTSNPNILIEQSALGFMFLLYFMTFHLKKAEFKTSNFPVFRACGGFMKRLILRTFFSLQEVTLSNK